MLPRLADRRARHLGYTPSLTSLRVGDANCHIMRALRQPCGGAHVGGTAPGPEACPQLQE